MLTSMPIITIILGIIGAIIIGHKIAHLYFGHREYTDGWTDKILSLVYVSILGQGSPMQLAYVHRMHHKYADTENDPHSPKHIGKTNVYFLNWKRSKIKTSIISDYRHSKFQKYLTKNTLKIHIIFLLFLFLLLGFNTVGIVSSIVVFNFHYSSITNTFSHNNNGPINNYLIKYIMPWGYMHKEHHDKS
jgi:fatty-acid desaturase